MPLVEDSTVAGSTDGLEEEEEEEEFFKLEQFLAEHQVMPEDTTEAYDEPDVAEALAVSWCERRKEMGQLQRARKFKQAQDVKVEMNQAQQMRRSWSLGERVQGPR